VLRACGYNDAMPLWEDIKNLWKLGAALLRPSSYAPVAPPVSQSDSESAAVRQAEAEQAAFLDRWSMAAVEHQREGTLERLESDLLAAYPGQNAFSMRWKMISLFERLAEEFDRRGDRPAAGHFARKALALYEDDRIDESAGAGGAAALARMRDAEARLRRFLFA